MGTSSAQTSCSKLRSLRAQRESRVLTLGAVLGREEFGGRKPCSLIGLLGALRRIRRRGFCVDIEEPKRNRDQEPRWRKARARKRVESVVESGKHGFVGQLSGWVVQDGTW